jgi:hypothetical protein
MISINDILKHDVFEKIHKVNIKTDVYKLMQMETPLEWTSEGINDVTGLKYRYLPIEVSEAIYQEIFGYGLRETILSPVITTINGFTTVTQTANYEYGLDNEFKLSGTASITVCDNFYYDKAGAIHFRTTDKRQIRSMELLVTATPLALTKCRQNFYRNIAPLFGRNLNRNTVEELPVIQTEEPPIPIDKETERMLKLIDTCTTLEDLYTYKIIAYSKGISEQYDNNLKELTDAAN